MIIYAKAVFMNGWTPIFYTALVPICTGISQVVHLVILLNSSAIRLATIYLVPVLYILYIFSGFWTTELNIATGIVACGVVVYNFTLKCGTELLIDEDVDVKNKTVINHWDSNYQRIDDLTKGSESQQKETCSNI